VPWPGATAAAAGAAGAAGGSGRVQQQPLGPAKPREVVMDRLQQHTLQCKSCSAALKWVQRLQVRGRGRGGFERGGVSVCLG
jgi:hypothetical protein